MKRILHEPPRSLRRLTASVLLLFAFGLPAVPQAWAQRGPGGGMDRELWVDRLVTTMTERVGLSKAQVEAVRPLLSDHFDGMQSIREKARGQGRAAMRERMTKHREALDRSVEALLAPEQVDKYRAMREARPWGGRRSGRRGG